MRDNTTLPSVCRVAAHAAYLATCKYVTLIGECDAYTIAIGVWCSTLNMQHFCISRLIHCSVLLVMCPDKKLHWFYSNGWPRDEVELIRQQVIETFNRRFKSSLDAASRNSPDAGRRAQTMVPPAEHIVSHSSLHIHVSYWCLAQGVERFRPASRMQGSPHPGPNVDDINYYLSTSPLMLPPNMTALEYWTKELTATPCLAKMGLAFMSAPGKSAASCLFACSSCPSLRSNNCGRRTRILRRPKCSRLEPACDVVADLSREDELRCMGHCTVV